MPGVDDNESQSSTPPTAESGDGATTMAPSAAGPTITAVDTGRRIDPSQLSRGRPSVARGDRGGERRGPAHDGKGKKPERSGPVIERINVQRRADETAEGEQDATVEGAPAPDATTAERPHTHHADAEAKTQERAPGGAGGRRDPRGERRGGGRGERRPPRGDRGERRDAGPREERPREKRIDFSGMAPIVVPRSSPEEIGDFAAMLAQTGPIDRVELRVGDKVRARCVHMGSDTAFFELSRTQEAQAPIGEFLDKEGACTLKPGDRIDAFVTSLADGIHLSTRLGKDMIDVGMLEAARAAGMPVQGTVTGHNQGGLEVSLSGSARAFCPIGQIDVSFVEDPATLVGKTMEFLVREVKEGGKNVVLSRKALVERQKKEQGAKTLAKLSIGVVAQGSVTRLQPFGAFVDLGGVDGLIPISELSWGRVKDPSDVLKVGDRVTVEITKIEEDPKRPGQQRIGLSLKSTLEDPFISNAGKLVPGAWLEGTVQKLEAYGAFVELFPGVSGLVHVSNIADRRIVHPKDVLNVGERVKTRILEVDGGTRRVSLTLKDEPSFAEAVDESFGGGQSSKRSPYGRGARVAGAVERVEKYGAFVKLDAADGKEPTTVFLPASESGTPKGTDLHKSLPVGSHVELLIIDVDERGRLKGSRTALEKADERALFDQFKTDKKASGGAGLGTFGDLLKAKLGK
ncbi:MAG: S1 RNA-binding domain-containing protein [Deltaproteobacteria bacterium]|nr:S1 RNA-binding domain-containing protein [Deltaproteobacteria bacterium]